MNSAVFIRRKSVLALWLITPLALMAGLIGFSGVLLGREKERLQQDQELAVLIPEMTASLDEFKRFSADYQPGTEQSKLSMEDHHIGLFNVAAEKTKFIITAINLVPDNTENETSAVTRISLFVKGIGTTAEIAAFLDNIKRLDRLVYENQLQITPDRSRSGEMQLDAEFGRVYLKNGGWQ